VEGNPDREGEKKRDTKRREDREKHPRENCKKKKREKPHYFGKAGERKKEGKNKAPEKNWKTTTYKQNSGGNLGNTKYGKT